MLCKRHTPLPSSDTVQCDNYLALQDPAAVQELQLKQLMKQQLSHPRRVLAAAAPPGGPPPSAPPQLTMQIVQRNTTKAAAATAAAPSIEELPNAVLSPAAFGFHPVSQAITCNLKEGQAVKCNAAITSSSLTDAFVAGQENYLVLSLNTPGQVSTGCTAVLRCTADVSAQYRLQHVTQTVGRRCWHCSSSRQSFCTTACLTLSRC
jgi:hypothetical protein